MISLIEQFLSGAVMMGYFAASAFFYRYWKKSGDSLFRYFSGAFCLLAIERIILLVVTSQGETQPIAYTPRLIAFMLIIVAILAKNRESRT